MAGRGQQVRTRTESSISKVVWRGHKNPLKHSLNVAIFPFLVQESLISDEDQLRYSDPKTTQVKKRDIIIQSVPRSGQPGYVLKFIKCLRDSSEEAGQAHEQLADSMEADYNKHKGNSTRLSVSQTTTTTWDLESGASTTTESVSFTSSRVVTTPSVNAGTHTVNDCSHNQEQDHSIIHLIKKYRTWICLHSSALLWLILGAILSGILTQVPPINEIQPTLINGKPNILIDLGINPFWISSAVFSIDTSTVCSGSIMFVVGSSTCEELPKTVQEFDQNGIGDPIFIYLLPGSSINITIKPRDNLENVEIWILQSIAKYNRRSSLLSTSQCDNPPDKTWCYKATEYAGQPLPFFNVNESDYYFLLVNTPLPTGTIFFYTTYTFNSVTFNMTAIQEQYHPMGSSIEQNSKVDISHPLSRNRDSCIILSANCPASNSDYRLTRDEITRRIDLILSPMIAGLFVCILHLLVSCSVHFGYVRTTNRNSSLRLTDSSTTVY